MGETELVLDGMTVEDALRIVGGAGGRAASGGRRQNAGAESERAAPAPSTPPAAPTASDVHGDWRAALRSAGAAPDRKPAASPPAALDPRPSTLDPQPKDQSRES